MQFRLIALLGDSGGLVFIQVDVLPRNHGSMFVLRSNNGVWVLSLSKILTKLLLLN